MPGYWPIGPLAQGRNVIMIALNAISALE